MPVLATVRRWRPRPKPAAVTRNTTAYAGYGATAADGITAVGAKGHVYQPIAVVTATEAAPAASVVVGRPPEVAHRSQKIVAAPTVVLAAKVTLERVKA